MNVTNFDKKRCLELLKEKKCLEKEGKFFWEYDKEKNDELIKYLTLLHDQIFWTSRTKYVKILELFSNKKISLDEFLIQFGRLSGSNFKEFRMWENNLEAEAYGISTQSNEINCELNLESGGFTKILSDLNSLVDICDPDITLEMNLKNDPELLFYGMSEEFFRLRIEKYFLPQLKKYCNES